MQRAEVERLLSTYAVGQKHRGRRRTLRNHLEALVRADPGGHPPAAEAGVEVGADQSAHSEDGREVQPVLETGTGTTRTDHCEKTPKRRKTTDVVEWGEIDVRPGFPCDQDEAEKVWPVTIWPLSARPWAWYGWSRAWSKVVITAPVVVEETDEANGRGPGKPCCKPHGQSASTILQATGDGTLTVSIVGPEVRGQVEAHSAFLGFPALRSRKKVAKDVLQ